MQIIQVPINKLKADPNQPRKSFNPDRIEELANSIKTTGIINPIEIDKNFTIITGEYRWRASKEAGLKEVPCKMVELNPEERFTRQLIENVQHTEMTAWDTAQAIKKLMEKVSPGHTFKGGRGNEEGVSLISRKIGKGRDFIIEHLRLLESSEPIKKAVRSGKLPISHIRAISRVPQEYKKAIEKKILSGEFKTRDGALTVVESIKRNPDKAKEILSKNYSKYDTTYEVNEALTPIAPRLSDVIKKGFESPMQLSDILLALSRWLDGNTPESVGTFHLKRIIADLVMTKQEIQEWIDPHPNQNPKKLLKSK